MAGMEIDNPETTAHSPRSTLSPFHLFFDRRNAVPLEVLGPDAKSAI
jgi:hypothetical protein